MEELFRVWDDRFRESYGPLPTRVRKLLERFLRCGDLHFGFLRLYCECGKDRLVPFSCKARGLCPSCSKKRALIWAERRVEEVLPQVPYVAPSFTIPKMLRKHFLWDRSLYGALSRTACASVREFFQEHFPGLSGAVPAMVVSPQSFGSLANFHPHLHSVVSLGVFNREGNFHPAPDDIDCAPLEELFRQRTLKMMFQREKITPERVELLRSWRHSGFHVDARRRLQAEDRKGLQNVLQYMERPPVALERLEYRSDGLVHYTGNYHPSLGRDHQLLPPLDFLALLVHHILLREGRRFIAADIGNRKQLLNARLRDIFVFDLIVKMLKQSDRNEVDEGVVLSQLALHFPHEHPGRILRTIIGWGRYGELFKYSSTRKVFFGLRQPDATS